jgi:peptidoglycan/xylan/chitin deacetylase (PgdA/CDA1 family)
MRTQPVGFTRVVGPEIDTSPRIARTLLRYGRDVVKANLASAFTETALGDLMSSLRRRFAGPRVYVLAYHRVTDVVDVEGETSAVNPSLCISAAAFRRQMIQVKQKYDVLPLSEAMAAIAGARPLVRDACAITFDDGYADVALRAAPILAELGIPGTVFIPSGYVGIGAPLLHDRLYAALWRRRRRRAAPLALPSLRLSERVAVDDAERLARTHGPQAATDRLIAALPDASLRLVVDALEEEEGAPSLDPGARVLDGDELRALADAGWEVGAHTIDHVVLTHERGPRVVEQLVRPRRAIEAITGKPCRYFAYCNGLWSASLVAAVRAAGYEGAVTTFARANRPGGDPFRVSRKCLWEGHTRGPDGRWSSAVSAANIADLFGDLGLTRPQDGEVAARPTEATEEVAS